MGLKKGLLLFAIIILVIPGVAFSDWSGSTEVVSGVWGIEPGQFGLKKGDTIAYDKYPGLLAISSSGRVLVGDELNKRIQIFSSAGALETVITSSNVPAKHQDTRWWPLSLYVCDDSKIITEIEEYTQTCSFSGVLEHSFTNIQGGVVQYLGDCSFITHNPDAKKFYKYSPTGELLGTYDERPLELGRTSYKCKQGISTLRKCQMLYFKVEYPDAVYLYQVAQADYKSDFKGQVRVNNDLIMDNVDRGIAGQQYVYAYSVTSTIPGIGDQKERRYLGFTAGWQIPGNQYGTPISLGPGVEPEIPIISEYGNPIIGPDGSIYCWMRSETHYKILKWTWSE